VSDGGVVLLTGAGGYVGGRLRERLEADGVRLRCLARRPENLVGRVGKGTEVVRGDVRDSAAMDEALRGVRVAYYLVHSMGGRDYARADREAAATFGAAAARAGVERIVYLGGLGEGPDLSEHLRSRQEVGQVLAESGVTTIELRASIIIGSGGISFEMIRGLVDRLPVMITPNWVRTRTQPIAIEDVVEYLARAAEVEVDGSVIVGIGGRDQMSYGELMSEYARQRGLRRLMIPVPVLTPHLSSLWLGLVTPVYARVGRQLVEGLRNETIVNDDLADRMFGLHPRGASEAIVRALVNEDRDFAATRWSDALSSRPSATTFGGRTVGSRRIDSRGIIVPVAPESAFAAIERMGGERGYYYGDRLWRLRGLLDLPFGGAGWRRGRRDPDRLVVGDTVDSWRVEAIERPRMLRLSAEMALPGRAWLQYDVDPREGGAMISQTAIFDPVGVLGRLYWYSLWLIHGPVFRGMLRGIAREATASQPLPTEERAP
jgi:uncharacterized protein YbjT (DUF2867 family)